MQSLSKSKLGNDVTCGILGMLSLFCGLSACSDSGENIAVEPDKSASITWRETHSISELKQSYADGGIITDTVIFNGKIASSNEAGNFDQVVYVQNSEALSIPLVVTDLSKDYEFGKEYLILATGLKYEKVSNTLVTETGEGLSMDEAALHFHVVDSNRTVNFEVITDLSDVPSTFQSKLVKVYGLQFDETQVGESYSDLTGDSRLWLSDENGQEVALQISPTASFSNYQISYHSGSIEGILKIENDRYTIIPRTVDDLEFSRERHSLFEKDTFSSSGSTLPYQVMYPREQAAEENYPLVIFLHGAGERGTDNERQMAYGTEVFTSQMSRENYPAIVVFPQCPTSDMWSRRIKETVDGEAVFQFPVEEDPNMPMQLVIGLTAEFIENESVDPSRVYVMGLSMGGIGALEYLYYAPDVPAAAISIAGGHDPEHVDRYGEKVAIRLYHGSDDTVVPPVYSRELIAALDQLSSEDAEYFEAEGKGHEWNYVLDEEELLPWLWSKSKVN